MKAEEFIKVWQKAKSLEEVVRRTGLQPKSASNRASVLRSKGIPLQKFREGTTASVADLKALAEKHRRP